MATITPLKAIPHTRIENSIIDEHLPEIGVYEFTIYAVIKRHLNQKTGECYPSYKTIARKIGIDRSTVIRYVNKLKALNLLSPLLRFKEDGSPTSNQYSFEGTENSAPSKKTDKSTKICDPGISRPSNQYNFDKGSGTQPLPVIVQDNHPSSPQPPKQSSFPNKKQRTIAEVDLMPTEKQKACPHPPSAIVFLPDHITICHHCYGLLDENLKRVEEDKPAQAVYAA